MSTIGGWSCKVYNRRGRPKSGIIESSNSEILGVLLSFSSLEYHRIGYECMCEVILSIAKRTRLVIVLNFVLNYEWYDYTNIV